MAAHHHITKIIDQVKAWLDNHKGMADSAIGGGIGFLGGLSHWWDHFTEPDVLYKFWDGVFSTAVHTIVGALLLWFIHRFILKTKKKDETHRNSN